MGPKQKLTIIITDNNVTGGVFYTPLFLCFALWISAENFPKELEFSLEPRKFLFPILVVQ
jgi:hypothetical protein